MRLRGFAILLMCISFVLTYAGFRLGQNLLGIPSFDTRWLDWTFFLTGYAICSGANVAYFSFSMRDLKKTVERGKDALPGSDEARQAKQAQALLGHLEDPNWTLAAILLTNVAFGVQLSQLSDELFAGILAIIVPIVGITIVGEFLAQATFLRYAGAICNFFSPLIWILKWVTSPVSYPLARAVDAIYGREALRRMSEQDLLSDLRLELSEFGGDHPRSACRSSRPQRTNHAHERRPGGRRTGTRRRRATGSEHDHPTRV